MSNGLEKALEKAYHNRDEESYEELLTALRRDGFSSRELFDGALRRVEDILSCSITHQQYLEAIFEVFGEYMGTAASRARLNDFLREAEKEYKDIWGEYFQFKYLGGVWIDAVPWIRMISVEDSKSFLKWDMEPPPPGYRSFWKACLEKADDHFGKEAVFITDPYSWRSFLTFGSEVCDIYYHSESRGMGLMAEFYIPGMERKRKKRLVSVGGVSPGFLYLVPEGERPDPERVIRVPYPPNKKPFYPYERLRREYTQVARVKGEVPAYEDGGEYRGTLLRGSVGILTGSSQIYFSGRDLEPMYEDEEFLFFVATPEMFGIPREEFLLSSVTSESFERYLEIFTPPPGKMQPYVNHVYGY